MMNHSTTRRLEKRGIALLVVLLLLTILTVVITVLATTTKTELKVSSTYVHSLQNRAGVDSAITLARNQLRADSALDESSRSNLTYDAPTDPWARPVTGRQIGEARISYWIVDEARRINLNWVLDQEGNVSEDDPYYQQVRRLFRELGMKSVLFQRLVKFLQGRHDSSRQTDQRNLLRSPEELLRIRGFTRRILYGGEGRKALVRYATVWPVRRPSVDRAKKREKRRKLKKLNKQTNQEGRQPKPVKKAAQNKQARTVNQSDGLVNLNTARRPVLRALVPDDRQRTDVADLILTRRKSTDDQSSDQTSYFTTKSEVREVLEEGGIREETIEHVLRQSSVRSRYFSIFLMSRSGDVTKTARVVVKRPRQNADEDLPRIVWFDPGVSLEAYRDVEGLEGLRPQ